MKKHPSGKNLRRDRHTVSLQTLSFIAKRLKSQTNRIFTKEFPHQVEFCDDHLWAPSCYHGSVENGFEVVEKYINGQDTHHAKSDMYRPRS